MTGAEDTISWEGLHNTSYAEMIQLLFKADFRGLDVTARSRGQDQEFHMKKRVEFIFPFGHCLLLPWNSSISQLKLASAEGDYFVKVPYRLPENVDFATKIFSAYFSLNR